MKTRVAMPPGVELNLDDPDQQRWALWDAMDEMARHPRPKRRPPPRSRWWWFWRAFGYVVFSPARLFWAWYHRAYYPDLPGGKLGPWTYRYPSSKRLEEWVRRHHGSRVKTLLYWLLVEDYCICHHCGFEDFHDEVEVPDATGLDTVTLDMFEHVDGGGVDYWGEAEDAHGWLWCWRCGSVFWESV